MHAPAVGGISNDSPTSFGSTEQVESHMSHLATPENPLRIERLPQVKARTGYSRSSLYALIAAERFPAPILLGPRAVGWLSHEIDEWITSRVRAPRDGGPITTARAKALKEIVKRGPVSTEGLR